MLKKKRKKKKKNGIGLYSKCHQVPEWRNANFPEEIHSSLSGKNLIKKGETIGSSCNIYRIKCINNYFKFIQNNYVKHCFSELTFSYLWKNIDLM